MEKFSKESLMKLYSYRKLSMKEISKELECSANKVAYWMDKHDIPRRSISEAVYQRINKGGDPFVFSFPKTKEESILFGLGIGIYWGEGTKANKTSVRLGNSDPYLISKFILFLERFFAIQRDSLRFGLQIFSDLSEDIALQFWQEELNIKKHQFYKVIITPYRSIGNYRKKTLNGVITVYFNNVKVRNILVDLIEQQKNDKVTLPKKAVIAQSVERIHGRA